MNRAKRALACAIAITTAFSAQAAAPSRNSATSHISGPWLRIYTLEPYAQYWHLRLKVRDLRQALPRILDALKKAGGEPTLPLANMAASPLRGYQQLSYRFSARGAEQALRKLRKLGTLEMLAQAPASSWDPATLQEVRGKLGELQAEMKTNRDSLQRMPAVSGLASELADHLMKAEAAYNSAKDRVLLNVEILQGPGR